MRCAVTACLLQARRPRTAFLFTAGLAEAEKWLVELRFWADRCDRLQTGADWLEIFLLPEVPDEEREHPRLFDLECDRLATLTRLLEQQRHPTGSSTLLVITSVAGFFHRVPPPQVLAASEIRLRKGATIGLQELARRLGHEMGYSFEVVCEMPGQYAVRGGILDVYPVNAEGPVRLDFFGEELESIRSFDPTSQRSTGHLESIVLAALPTTAEADNEANCARDRHIFDYLPPDPIDWIFLEPLHLQETAASRFEVLEIPGAAPATFQDLFTRRTGLSDGWYALTEFEIDQPLLHQKTRKLALQSEDLSRYRSISLDVLPGADRLHLEEEARQRFLDQLLHWQTAGFALWVVGYNNGEVEQLQRLVQDYNQRKPNAPRLEPIWLTGSLPTGFRLDWTGLREVWPAPDAAKASAEKSPSAKRKPTNTPTKKTADADSGLSSAKPVNLWSTDRLVLVTGAEISGTFRLRPAGMRRRALPQKAQVEHLLDFAELAEGDFLVHAAHGICRYRGLARMTLRGRQEEVISLEFADQVTLHLPLSEAHLLSRYVGLTRIQPKLGRVGSGQWEKSRRAAEKATLDLAAQLLQLQASRDTSPGHAFASDTPWQREFEAAFPYQETPDQARSIREVKADMEKPRPMDRLLCGDVGFGKTEVALRAAFKAVMDNKQVAVLAPTTVLAQQHYYTFQQRLANFPVSVELVSRFRSPKQIQAILARAVVGKVDILIGTHRLLSPDVRLPRLGLLVIDEEHRFGVKDKECLKLLKENIDVLTMSATPIPRTLYMALTGARDLSVIETPPADRLPVQTIVKNYSPEIVREAVQFEIQRGGQVFYLHNRVDTIESVALRLQEMMPNLRIGIGHGQMPESMLEKIMARFVAGDYDVLVCTTIIESGLDIPNCNTIMIESADRFGLAQLYQLRGRVGRFNRQAYCYLLLHRHARMLDQARKRLAAIRQYNQLGAGFKIAMRDLELRGVGNLLGAEQSGHIATVGFDLYCQLLRQSIQRLKGDPAASRVRAQVRLDFVQEADSAAPKLGYQVLKDAEMAGRTVPPIEIGIPLEYIGEVRLRIDFYRRLSLADSLEAVQNCEEAMIDRFGPLPGCVRALVEVTRLRILAESAGIALVETEGNLLKCLRSTGRKDDYVKIGTRFPRLMGDNATLRLEEIKQYLQRWSADSNR